MLEPFAAGPVAAGRPVPEPRVTTDSGPSADLTAETGFDKAVPAPAESSSAPLPLLIGSTPGFSMDLLKPLNSPRARQNKVYTVAADQVGGYCDPNYIGPPIRFSQTVELQLDDLLNQLHSRFGVNFVIGPDVAKLPINVKASSIPWNVLLRSQLYVLGVHANCVDSNTVELVLNSKVGQLQNDREDAGELVSRYIKLKYLQPSSGGNQNIAGQSTGGGGSSQSGSGGGAQNSCQSTTGGAGISGGSQGGGQTLPQRCKFERLFTEIQKILGVAGTTNQLTANSILNQNGGSQGTEDFDKNSLVYRQQTVSQVPGRNMFFVRGTARQLRDIDELIRYADIPPFQVVIKGLVYTANEDKLKDIGSQVTIMNNGTGRTSGGLFGDTLGVLGTLFDFSTLVGTVNFDFQVSALQRDGVISIKSRPFATVLDGDTTDLTVGRQVPVIIQAANNIGGSPGTLQILQAANLLSVTPHVIDDDQGNPTGVNLELRLESNDVDTSVSSQGVPAVSVRSIQSNFILTQEQTAILGGFTVDSDSKTISKTPGLGDIPILGELFKRRVRASQINRLYFAISVTVIPYGGAIEPVKVPKATTDPPTITPTMLKRAEEGEPKGVPTPGP